jgi:hypothetical protein
MKDEQKFNTYSDMIADLDREHSETLAAQDKPTGDRAEIYTEVSRRIIKQNEYELKRQKLVELRDDAMGVSPAVEAFLNPKKIESKFDVDSGKTKIDDSLNPLGGKKL